jgi:hypothetical protein
MDPLATITDTGHDKRPLFSRSIMTGIHPVHIHTYSGIAFDLRDPQPALDRPARRPRRPQR